MKKSRKIHDDKVTIPQPIVSTPPNTMRSVIPFMTLDQKEMIKALGAFLL